MPPIPGYVPFSTYISEGDDSETLLEAIEEGEVDAYRHLSTGDLYVHEEQADEFLRDDNANVIVELLNAVLRVESLLERFVSSYEDDACP